jgi:hypothetical protein
MSFHLSLFKMVGLHYMPFFACHDCKDNTSSAAGLKTYRIQLSGDELRLKSFGVKSFGVLILGLRWAKLKAHFEAATLGTTLEKSHAMDCTHF